MIKRIFTLLMICALFSSTAHLCAEPIISFFFRPYARTVADQDPEDLLEKAAHKPGKIAKDFIKAGVFDTIVSGILSTYGGFLCSSDYAGLTTFPRKHEKSFVYIIITNRVTPIMRTEYMVDHFELEYGTPALCYKAEQLRDDKTGMWFWRMELVHQPANRIIPLESITIIAEPQYIIVPLGDTLTTQSPHLLLPDLFVKRGIQASMYALYLLPLRHFFGSVNELTKKEATRYRSVWVY